MILWAFKLLDIFSFTRKEGTAEASVGAPTFFTPWTWTISGQQTQTGEISHTLFRLAEHHFWLADLPEDRAAFARQALLSRNLTALSEIYNGADIPTGRFWMLYATI